MDEKTVMRSPEETLQQDIISSCPVKTLFSAGAGFALGGLLGMFMSSIDFQTATDEFQKLTTKEQMKLTLKDMGSRTWSSAKNFGMVAALFSSSECMIESYRAKHDIWNGVGAGCFAGAALAYKGSTFFIFVNLVT